ncbi:hypothetical protein BGW38_003312 [Lunasporangiospora selenospora]|uniref:NUDE domain-containing protein n=1 Tax=Lunasporangiospora selenospora TaxID=979761 RepID=A0A9P6FRL7_9FUNG|nr:hypothetical protein BGW38_003312 [Lunasporangiospora selenospora]
MPSTTRSFQNINEELEYYKQHAEELDLELNETRLALEEFQESSKELEEELEKEIESTEKRYNEIKIRNESMRQEVDDWKEKYQQSTKMSNTTINQLTRQLEELKQQTDMFIKKERELEQDNDDLERKGRAASWSLQEMERKYNVALERTAFLEHEITSKITMSDELQRLKDELRDANVELAVMKTNQQTMAGSATSLSSYAGSTSSLVDSATGAPRRSLVSGTNEAMPAIRARLAKNAAQRTSMGTNRTSIGTGGAGNAGLSTPHQNPVKMVQEMVGRVKSLEARLVSCRSLVTPLLQPPPSYSTSNATSAKMSHSGSHTGSRPGSPNYSAATSPKAGRRTSSMMHQQHRTLSNTGLAS